MSRKRRRERRAKIPPKTTPAQPLKTRSWTVSTVLGLALGTVGLVVGVVELVELRPQISVAPQEAIEKSQPFSVPFRIDNTGYFSLNVEHVFCYLHRMESEHVSVYRGTLHDPSWNRFEIDRGHSKTIICNLQDQIKPLGLPKAADIAIVVDYHPFGFPKSFRKYFRFVGAYVDNWQWLQQPPEAIQKEADFAIADHMKQIPQSR